MVSLRLTRGGKKNAPAYRIIATHKRSKRDGGFLEILGHYNPSENPVKFEYNKERYEYWVKTGAIPSDAVSQLVRGIYKYTPYNKGKAAVDNVVEKSEATPVAEAETTTAEAPTAE